VAAPAIVFTIARAAEILGEDEELMWEPIDQMEPEDGRLWVFGNRDQQTVAFTDRGLECLRELLAERRRSRAAPRP
jgi:hypothetical protein